MPSCAPGWNHKLCLEHLLIYQTWCDRSPSLKQSLEKPPTLAAWVSRWYLSKWRRDVEIFALSVEAAFANKGWPHTADLHCLSLLVRAVQAVFLSFSCWPQKWKFTKTGNSWATWGRARPATQVGCISGGSPSPGLSPRSAWWLYLHLLNISLWKKAHALPFLNTDHNSILLKCVSSYSCWPHLSLILVICLFTGLVLLNSPPGEGDVHFRSVLWGWE